MTPIPPGSSKIEAYGKFVRPSDAAGAVRSGSPANLIIVASDHILSAGRASHEDGPVGGIDEIAVFFGQARRGRVAQFRFARRARARCACITRRTLAAAR